MIPVERIEQSILLIRGEKVMLDSDLAELYGVTTKRLNEQVKRNIERFPSEFMLQLTADEKAEVVVNSDHLKKLKFSPNLPYVFTKYAAIMLAVVLKKPDCGAGKRQAQIVKAFVRLRQLLASNKKLVKRLDELEKKYDFAPYLFHNGGMYENVC